MRAIFIPLIVAILWTATLSHAQAAPQHKDRSYYEARGDIVWEVPTKEKIIALTFDDGPDPTDTPAILELLKQYQAKATFFAIGKHVEQYPDIARREILEGHEIANHTYNHSYFHKRIVDQKIQDEIQKAERIIINATGQRPSLFRPPGGFYGDNVVSGSQKAGYLVVMWSWHQDTEDWNTPGVNKIVSKVLNNARNGDIVLFHDHVKGKTQTVEALKQVLPALKERGYRFVTVSELLTHRKSTTVSRAEQKPEIKEERQQISIQINPAKNELSIFLGEVRFKTYPIALGKPDTPTPIGDFKVINKFENWGSGFGTRWLGLNVPWGIYGIHGTNKPHSIGTDASHGCVRMLNRHVEDLFKIVHVGTKVTILGHVLGEPFQDPRRLAQGNSGGDVMLIQSRLSSAGLYRGKCNGKFNASTERALKAFEKANELPVDGVMSMRDYMAMGLVE